MLKVIIRPSKLCKTFFSRPQNLVYGGHKTFSDDFFSEEPLSKEEFQENLNASKPSKIAGNVVGCKEKDSRLCRIRCPCPCLPAWVVYSGAYGTALLAQLADVDVFLAL